MQEKEVYDYLTAHGVKVSVQRVAVMQYLLQQMGHPTVDEIYQALVDHIPTLSKTTVYNTLRLLMEHGVVRMLTIEGKNANYEGVTEPHAHFLCHQCGRIFNIESPDHLLSAPSTAPQGFAIESADLYYRGVCPECLAKQDT